MFIFWIIVRNYGFQIQSFMNVTFFLEVFVFNNVFLDALWHLQLCWEIFYIFLYDQSSSVFLLPTPFLGKRFKWGGNIIIALLGDATSVLSFHLCGPSLCRSIIWPLWWMSGFELASSRMHVFVRTLFLFVILKSTTTDLFFIFFLLNFFTKLLLKYKNGISFPSVERRRT
jgi:hypothetical protein